jgi:hypothetical protein
MKTKKTVSKLASDIMKTDITFAPTVNALFASTRKRKRKADDLCVRNRCVNPTMKELGIRQLNRKDMPQFNSLKDMVSFTKDLKRNRIRVKHGFMDVYISELTPTQFEIRKSKVEAILTSWNRTGVVASYKKTTPIFTSNTGDVIDGHHRSEALRMAVDRGLIPDTIVTVYAIHMPAWIAIGLANTFGYNSNPSHF